ncbi:MAG: hypothetical protein ABW221_06295 [Vicinamibacteria bacterium]
MQMLLPKRLLVGMAALALMGCSHPTSGMNPWTGLIGLSAIAGLMSATFVRGPGAIAVGGVVPWFGLLGWLLYNEYLVPYQGGGASMWPIAQLFGGTIAAVVGGLVAALATLARDSAGWKGRRLER